MADRPSSTAPGTVYEALPAAPQTTRRPYSEHRPGRARPTLNDRSDAGLASAVVAALLPCPVWALETRERRADDEADAAPDSACAIASPGCAVSTKPRRRRPQRSAGSVLSLWKGSSAPTIPHPSDKPEATTSLSPTNPRYTRSGPCDSSTTSGVRSRNLAGALKGSSAELQAQPPAPCCSGISSAADDRSRSDRCCQARDGLAKRRGPSAGRALSARDLDGGRYGRGPLWGVPLSGSPSARLPDFAAGGAAVSPVAPFML
jgi:hypothetical protein